MSEWQQITDLELEHLETRIFNVLNLALDKLPNEQEKITTAIEAFFELSTRVGVLRGGKQRKLKAHNQRHYRQSHENVL